LKGCIEEDLQNRKDIIDKLFSLHKTKTKTKEMIGLSGELRISGSLKSPDKYPTIKNAIVITNGKSLPTTPHFRI